MNFNIGFYCPKCGPIPKAKNKTIRKIQYQVCEVCESFVNRWTRPLTERDGRCRTCGNASFKLRIVNGDIIRLCKRCFEKYNVDKDKVIRKGKRRMNYEFQNIARTWIRKR